MSGSLRFNSDVLIFNYNLVISVIKRWLLVLLRIFAGPIQSRWETVRIAFSIALWDFWCL